MFLHLGRRKKDGDTGSVAVVESGVPLGALGREALEGGGREGERRVITHHWLQFCLFQESWETHPGIWKQKCPSCPSIA